MSVRARRGAAVLVVVGLAAFTAACGDDDGGGSGADAGTVDGGLDAGPTGDAGPPDGGTATGTCAELGLPSVAMQEGATAAWGEIAGDFTAHTLDGSFTLSEEWSGCESYVFLAYADTTFGNGLWRSFPDPLFANAPRDVHYFFVSWEETADAARARAEEMRTSVEEALSFLGPEDAEHWRSHTHFVTDPVRDIEGSIGELAGTLPYVQYGFAIDRRQRFDQVGSLAKVTSSGFVPRLEMAAWAPHHYDYRAELEARLAAETDTTVIPLVSETDWSERVFDRSVDLPDAATMAGFDTLEMDVEITCRRDAANCSEWDRIAKIELCVDSTCDARRELVRWITPYARPGSRRWVMDASPLLGLLRDGGAKTFRITMGPSWEDPTERDVEMSLRLRDAGTGEKASGAELAFTGGAFDAGYDALHPPFHFTPPSGTSRVELVVILSGHGQTDGDNCAEWCNHVHDFQVNGGTLHRVDYPGEIGEPLGCAERSSAGVIPGQYGNWAPARAYWCPGLPVDAIRIDVTDDVTVGADNELTYDASFAGGEPRGGNVDLSVYVVYY